MSEYECPSCQEVVSFDGFARVTWCNTCGSPLTLLNLLPVVAMKTEPHPDAEVEDHGAVA